MNGSRDVVLVPGVGLFGIEMAVLGWRLRKMGYDVVTFWTNPCAGDLKAKAAALHALLIRRRITAPMFVAHSFGGHILLQFLNDFPDIGPVRAVTLGSPLCGCGGARRVMYLPGGRWIVTPALADAACAETPLIPHGCEVGAIAGRINLLLGAVLCPGKPNDTIVCVEETRHPALTAHVVLPVTHTSMLSSPRVADAVDCFLKAAAFCPER